MLHDGKEVMIALWDTPCMAALMAPYISSQIVQGQSLPSLTTLLLSSVNPSYRTEFTSGKITLRSHKLIDKGSRSLRSLSCQILGSDQPGL